MTTALTLRPTLYEETVPGGGHTSFVLKRGQLLRITDIEGGANVSLLLFNAVEKSERLNLPDDVGRFILTRGARSMSALFDLLDRLDQASLQAQRKLTIPFLKETLGW